MQPRHFKVVFLSRGRRPANVVHSDALHPSAVPGTPEQVSGAFFEEFTILDPRFSGFPDLPLATLERELVQQEIDRIGRN